MFEINDVILYGSEGVCKIESIETKKIADNSIDYFVLKPIYSHNSTVYVPIHNQKLVNKMHRVLSVEEIDGLIKMIANKDCIWIDNENERKQTFKEILLSGNRVNLIQMIKTLYHHQQEQQSKGKRLRTFDEHFFTEAERILYDEFALVLDIEQEQVLPFIMKQVERYKTTTC